METIKRVPASGPEGLEEMNWLLAESAPLAQAWAPQSCWVDPESGENCAWYHGIWQMLRLLGIVTTLTHHAVLYITALRPLIATGKFNRVMLSGAADYGLLAIILEAFQREGAVPEITLVDRCETPLRLCRWYAERFGYPIKTILSDLASFQGDQSYDLACAHSLLTRVPVEDHAKVAAVWSGMLRPGGILMMANVYFPGAASTKADFAPDQIQRYVERVTRAAGECPHGAALPAADKLARMAEAYAGHMNTNVIGSREHLVDLLQAHGFDFVESRFGDLIKDPRHQISGAQSKNKKAYAWIVARRR